ncbi:hypothetical protein HPB50_000140 [Hyalomma asiaticum]|uniref:Uncharacterized protein n=1 Tax=Hyalomma asiaticum TaxID=266040 RepID=A0ACB7RZE2_HYAAI|nr:hypothetical protein HPB50_000140 [Hyalomma asiaticum]
MPQSKPAGRLPSGATDPGWVSWKKLPEPTICDYIILDIEANPDGSYNGAVVDFLILLSISAPRPTCLVEGLSAWNHRHCFIKDDVQPTFGSCLELISSVRKPASRFALTLSLRIDVFVDVEHSPNAHPSVVKSTSVGKKCYARTHRHIRRGKWVRAVNAGLEAEEEESAIVCVSDVMDEPAGVKRLETPLPPRESLNAHRVFDQERSPMGMDSAAVHPLPGSVGFSDPAGYKQKADQAGAQASSPSNMSPAAAINPDLGSRGPVHDTQRSEDRERLAIIAVLALSLVFACTILSFFLPEAKLLGDLSGWCDTSECRSHASLLTDGLNRSVDPCRDIDAYVCSTWHPNPVFAPFLHMALDDLSIRWLEDLEKLLRDSVFHMPVAEKPLAMYRACVDNSGADLVDRAVFRRFLRDRGTLVARVTDEQRQCVEHNSGPGPSMGDVAVACAVRVLEHPFVPGGRRFLLLPGRNSDARLFVAMHENVMKTGGYARYWHMIHYFVTSREPGHDVSDVIKRSAETQGISVAMLLQIMFMGSYVTPSIFRISNNGSDVGNRTGGYWVKSLSTHLFPLQPLSPSDDVLIANTELLEVLRKFIQGRGDKEALTHISWQVVQMYAVMLDKELLLNILENTQEAAALNAMLCAREVDAVYNPVLTVLYARSRLTSTSKTQVNALYRTLMQRAVDAVKRLPWLDADGQQFFARRLQSTVVRLWPPDVFEDAEKVEEIYVHCPLREGSFMRLWVAVRQCLGDLLVGKHRAYVSAVAPKLYPISFHLRFVRAFRRHRLGGTRKSSVFDTWYTRNALRRPRLLARCYSSPRIQWTKAASSSQRQRAGVRILALGS